MYVNIILDFPITDKLQPEYACINLKVNMVAFCFPKNKEHINRTGKEHSCNYIETNRRMLLHRFDLILKDYLGKILYNDPTNCSIVYLTDMISNEFEINY